MQILRPVHGALPARRGAALLMAFLVIVVIILIAGQISRATSTSSRVARNEEILMTMDLAIESALLQVHEDLRADAEADAAAGEAGAGGGAGAAGAALGAVTGGGEPGGEGTPASDSREDDWARPQRTELNGMRLRILIQDEESKFNLLSIMTEDEEEAEKAFDRLVRVLDLARGDTEADIDGGQARAMAEKIKSLLVARRETYLPQAVLLSDDEENEDHSMLLSLRELVALEEFSEDDFRDFRDAKGSIVHSLESFLTVWSSLTTFDQLGTRGAASAGQAGGAADPGQPSAPGEGPAEGEEGSADGEGEAEGQGEGEGAGEDAQTGAGEDGLAGAAGAGDQGAGVAPSVEPVSGAINANTAPLAVLAALFDDREVPARFWSEVLEYRNAEDEEVEENEDPPLDEYGEEITIKQFFDDVNELSKVDGWDDIEPIHQGAIQQLVATQSNVFSIYVTARKPTGVDGEAPPPADREELVEQDANGTGLVRTVRQVVWRKVAGDGTVDIVPIVRWEVLDHVPYEVLDFPDEDR